MIGVVLVTHGKLAEAFIAAAEKVVGAQRNLEAIAIMPDQNAEDDRAAIMQAVKRVDAGKGVIILTDMFGGAPSNLAISLLQEGVIEVVAGVNLPTLVKLLSIRSELSMQDSLLAVQEAGRKYINIASSLLSK